MSLNKLRKSIQNPENLIRSTKGTSAIATVALVASSVMGVVKTAEAQPSHSDVNNAEVQQPAFPKIVITGANQEVETNGTVRVPREAYGNTAKVTATAYDPGIECWGRELEETDRMIKYSATEDQREAFSVNVPYGTSTSALYCAVPKGEVHVPAFLRWELDLIEDGTVTADYKGASASEYIDVIGQDIRNDSPSYLALHYGMGQNSREIAKLKERHATLTFGPLIEFKNRYTTESSIGWQAGLDINLDQNWTVGGSLRHVNSTLGTTFYPERIAQNARKYSLKMPNPDVQESRTTFMLRLGGFGEVTKGFELGGGVELGLSHAQWDDQPGIQYPNGDVEMINGISKTSPAIGAFVGANIYPHENILLGAELGVEGAEHNRIPGSLQPGMKAYSQARLKFGVTF